MTYEKEVDTMGNILLALIGLAAAIIEEASKDEE